MTARVGDTYFSDRQPPQAADSVSDAAARKRELRAALRRIRSAIPPSRRNAAARRAACHLLRWRRLRQARRVALYLSVRSELSTTPLLAALLRNGRSVWVPVTRGGEPRMRFVPLRANTCLRRSALNLPQPALARPQRGAQSMDLVLLPLVGFDACGRRLGNGGGYYDRALAAARRPLRVGFAYAAQEIARVPAEPWDLRLDAVVTERGLRRFR